MRRALCASSCRLLSPPHPTALPLPALRPKTCLSDWLRAAEADSERPGNLRAKAPVGQAGRAGRARCRLRPRTPLDLWGLLRMRTRWRTPRPAAELLVLLLCFGLAEPSGHAGNCGEFARQPARDLDAGRSADFPRLGLGPRPGVTSSLLCSGIWSRISEPNGRAGEKALHCPSGSERGQVEAWEGRAFLVPRARSPLVGEARRVFSGWVPPPLLILFPLTCFPGV